MKVSLPMRITTIVLAVAVPLLALLAGANRELFTRPPWVEREAFFYPYACALADDGSSWVVDSAMRRILHLDSGGRLLRILHGGQRYRGFFYAQKLGTDSLGRLYVGSFLPAEGVEYRIQTVQIQRFHPDGTFDRTVYSQDNIQNSETFPVSFSFEIHGDELLVLHGENDGLVLASSRLDGSGRTILRRLESDRDFVSVAINGDGSLAGAARDGTLWRALPGAGWEALAIPGLQKPWDLRYAPDGQLLVLDVLGGTILAFKGTGSEGLPAVRVLMDRRQTGGIFGDTMGVASSGLIGVPDKERQALLISRPDGGVTFLPGAGLSLSDHLFRWIVWMSIPLALVCGLGAVVLFVVHFMNRRRPLLLWQIGIFVPVIIVSQVVAYTQVWSVLSDRYQTQVRSTLQNSAHLVANLLPPGEVALLNHPSDLDSPAYTRLKESAASLVADGERTGAFNYLAVYRLADGIPHYVHTGSGTFGVFYPYVTLPGGAQDLFSRPGVVAVRYMDDYGMYDAAFASLSEPGGAIVGVVEIGLYADLVQEVETAYQAQSRIFIGVSGIVFVALFILQTILLLRSLNSLRRMTREIASGRLDLPVELGSHDEVGQLGRAFGEMSGRLKRYMEDITALTVASARFVPRDFIEILGVEDLTGLQLGDQTCKDMTVMFSSVTNFPVLTSHLTPRGVFSFLNAYLSNTVPAIRDSGGCIDKYLGETFMALFPRSPADALRCWKRINHRLLRHNQKRIAAGNAALQVTFGIHAGPVMMGIVGEKERMEGTVISDSVNLASRINGLGRIYGLSCLATRSTVEAACGGTAPELRKAWPFRMVDHVTVKGRTVPVPLCQILDDQDPRDARILGHLDLWDEAFGAWEAGRLAESLDALGRFLRKVPDDPVALKHRARVEALMQEPLPDGWSPAVVFHEK